jgi:C4-dicarboxylate-specific signal transduction histidine kinase
LLLSLHVLKRGSNVFGISVFGKDITERKRAEEEIRRIREQYTHIARVSAMGELTASLAHELKQPLAAIRSNAQAALRFLTGDKPNIDELHEILKDIIIDNRRADDVIKKLRTLMRKSEFHITKLNMKELVQDIVPLVTSHEAMRKISLSLELDETIPLVAGDRIQLQQVILNLILNSTEALMNMKEISRSIIVRTYQEDTRTVTLSVKDNGPGIEDKAMPHLFEAFYTTKTEGLGMGLTICRSIVDEHRGRLWAENNPEGGATFYFTIPIAKENLA